MQTEAPPAPTGEFRLNPFREPAIPRPGIRSGSSIKNLTRPGTSDP